VNDAFRRSVPLMGTIVSIEVVGPDAGPPADARVDEAIRRAFDWFHHVEDICTRFDAGSELMQLTARAGTAVAVSALLFHAVEFAVALADDTDGAFDPTVGHTMESRGFNREHRTGRTQRTPIAAAGDASYRDVHLDPDRKTIEIGRPLVLDLGAVAKGLAVDLAARELEPFENYVVDAGGDLYVAGHNRQGAPWSIGIRHPRKDGEVLDAIRVSDTAVCTSGDYERRDVAGDAHHILDPRTGRSAAALASVTVLASSAMVADALATAAFVLGPDEGLRLLERHGAEGLLISPALERFPTRGMPSVAASG
jgi:FAD:protein FMN transferase